VVTIGRPYYFAFTDSTVTVALGDTLTLDASLLPGSGAREVPLLANSFRLQSNYPNPFNSSTTFRFTLAHDGLAVLKLYDLLGREAATVISGDFTEGEHVASFNAGHLASGIYFARLTSERQSAVMKVMLLK
jgi:hypothetical protein